MGRKIKPSSLTLMARGDDEMVPDMPPSPVFILEPPPPEIVEYAFFT